MSDNTIAKRSRGRLFRLAEPANAGGALFAHAVTWLFATAFYLVQSSGTLNPSQLAVPIGLGVLAALTLWVALDLARNYRPIRPVAVVTGILWLLLAGFYLARRGSDLVLAASQDAIELDKLAYLAAVVVIQIMTIVAAIGPLAASPITTRRGQFAQFKQSASGVSFRAVLSLAVFFGGWFAFNGLMDSSSLAGKYGDLAVTLMGAAVIVVGSAIIAVIVLRPLNPLHRDSEIRTWMPLIGIACICFVTANITSEFYWDYSLPNSYDAGTQARELRELIAQDPDNARLYWQLAPVYLRMRQPISALLVMQVYDQVREKNQYQSFTEKLREIRGTPYYLRVSSTREALKRSLQDLAKLNATVMAEHPVRLVEEFEPNQILQTAANAGGSALNIDAIELSIVGSSSCSKDDLAMLIPTESRAKWDAKYRLLKLCREAFQDASLRRAVMTGVADIARKLPSCLRYEMNSSGHLVTIDECPPGVKPSPPKPDPNCCSLALDDPDLRLLRNIDAVVVKLDAGARAAFLAVATRMLFKQQYLLNYIVCAPRPKRSSCLG